ncbi:hypothetical protein OH77DRAFT_1440752, partial [Trametes cingulata]
MPPKASTTRSVPPRTMQTRSKNASTHPGLVNLDQPDEDEQPQRTRSKAKQAKAKVSRSAANSAAIEEVAHLENEAARREMEAALARKADNVPCRQASYSRSSPAQENLRDRQSSPLHMMSSRQLSSNNPDSITRRKRARAHLHDSTLTDYPAPVLFSDIEEEAEESEANADHEPQHNDDEEHREWYPYREHDANGRHSPSQYYMGYSQNPRWCPSSPTPDLADGDEPAPHIEKDEAQDKAQEPVAPSVMLKKKPDVVKSK